MSSVYGTVTIPSPKRSVFNLSYTKKFTADMGLNYPVMCDELVPGDVFNISNNCVIRLQPLVAPSMAEMTAYVRYFFVPYRILGKYDDDFEEQDSTSGEYSKLHSTTFAKSWSEFDWEKFITGGKDGNDSQVLPRWFDLNDDATGAKPYKKFSKGSLGDYLGFPVNVNIPESDCPMDFPRRAYNMIWNEYYRDENLQDKVSWSNESLLRSAWKHDYFTACLPFQQKGIAPALPVTGTGTGSLDLSSYGAVYGLVSSGSPVSIAGATAVDGVSTTTLFRTSSGVIPEEQIKGALGGGTINSEITGQSVSISELRLAFQLQRFMERNARCGNRYTEFLRGHFGVSPRDDRLQRPEYIGGTKQPIIVSEVLQTSSTDATSPQGNMAGHGISVSGNYAGKYHATEFGLIMGILTVMPKADYMQGINRQWSRYTRYDFYFPEFAHLSEQGVLEKELFVSDNSTENNGVFGFQGRYNEMRSKQNMICGGMRDTFDYWHIARKFDEAPILNGSFIQCNPSKRMFAVQDEETMIINFANNIKAIRPMPFVADPI